MAAGVEIERKFLLHRAPDALQAHPSKALAQGYVAVHEDGVEVRVRREDERHVLTIKSGPAMVRTEEEFEIDARRFASLWALTEGRRLAKTRYLVPLGDLTAEVDVYHGELDGLVTAELEFPSQAASQAFTPPPWLGREVTGDKAYANQAVATAGAPPR